MHSNRIKFLSLFLILFATACKNPTDERQLLLEGKWYVHRAEFNGKLTDRLDGATYEFVNGQIISNLPQIGSGAYTFEKNKIIQQTPQTITYNVDTLTAKQLILEMTLREFDFKLFLGRDSLIFIE